MNRSLKACMYFFLGNPFIQPTKSSGRICTSSTSSQLRSIVVLLYSRPCRNQYLILSKLLEPPLDWSPQRRYLQTWSTTTLDRPHAIASECFHIPDSESSLWGYHWPPPDLIRLIEWKTSLRHLTHSSEDSRPFLLVPVLPKEAITMIRAVLPPS